MPPLDSTATLHGTPYAHPVETSTNLRSLGTFSNRPHLLFHTYTGGLERMGTSLQLPQASYLAPGTTLQLPQASYLAPGTLSSSQFLAANALWRDFTDFTPEGVVTNSCVTCYISPQVP
jgi:hypothetical protein